MSIALPAYGCKVRVTNYGIANLGYINVEQAITGLVGGAPSNLDGLVTSNNAICTGQMVAFIFGNYMNIYQLQSGVSATALPGIVRPLDFNVSSNARIWVQVL